MRTLKRTLILFAMFAVVGLMALSASAAEIIDSGECGAPGNDLTWTLDDEGTLTISGEGKMAGGSYMDIDDCVWYDDLPWTKYAEVVTSVIIKEGVTTVSEGAFGGLNNMQSVSIPTSIVSFGESAFGGCENLKEVYISDIASYLNIDADIYVQEGGFGNYWLGGVPTVSGAKLYLNGTEITDLVIPEGFTEIKDGLFGNCGNNFENVYFPKSLKSVNDYAFKGCSIKNLHLTDTPVNFGLYACDSVENIYVKNLDKWLSNRFNITFCSGGDDEPTTLEGMSSPLYSVKGLYVDNVLVEDLTIPSGCLRIYAGAFYDYDALKSIKFPSSVKTIEYCAFTDCAGITTIYFEGNAPRAQRFTEECILSCDEENCSECERFCVFDGITATAYYPADNATWTKSAKEEFGGNITWVAYTPSDFAKITTQPKTSNTQMGETAKMTVTATGNGLTYQWYVSDVGDTKYYLSSQSTNTYSIKMTEKIAGRKAYCIITDQYGNKVQTNTVELRMAATITAQPKSVCVANGAKATVKVTAVGNGLEYRWYYKDPGMSSYKYTSSFTGNTYSITMTDARAGRIVFCRVYDQYGNMVQSSKAKLSQPVKITKQPASVCVANGAKATVKVVAKGDGLTYKWYYKDPGMSAYKLTTSFKTNTYSVEMTDARAGRRVLCKVYDEYGNMVKSQSVALNQAVRITKQPVSVTVAKGATAKVTVTAKGDGLTYKWYYKDAGAAKYTYTSSFKTNTYSVSMTSARNGRRVLCQVFDKYGNKVQTNTVILKMK